MTPLSTNAKQCTPHASPIATILGLARERLLPAVYFTSHPDPAPSHVPALPFITHCAHVRRRMTVRSLQRRPAPSRVLAPWRGTSRAAHHPYSVPRPPRACGPRHTAGGPHHRDLPHPHPPTQTPTPTTHPPHHDRPLAPPHLTLPPLTRSLVGTPPLGQGRRHGPGAADSGLAHRADTLGAQPARDAPSPNRGDN